MFGLSSKGFKRKRYADIIESMNTRARDLFGENVNLSVRSPLGLFFRVIAWFIANLWELAEKVYFSGYVDTAEGNNLDYVTSNGGVVRRLAEKATGTITITGEDGTIVNKDFRVSSGNIQFETMEEVTIVNGTAIANIVAIDAGVIGNLNAGTIVEIVNPIEGIENVVNSVATTGGRNTETDAELRARYYLSFAAAGASTIDSIIAALLRTEGVRAANLEEITNEEGDVKGIRAIVLDGENNDIAQTILNYKAWGVKTFGAHQGTAISTNRQVYTLNFDRAVERDIYANITLKVSEEFSNDGVDEVKSKIIEYIGGEGVDSNLYSGLSMGENVVYSKLIKIIFEVVGVEDVDIEISTNGIDYSKSNINISFDEVAQTALEKLVVNIE